MRDDLDAAEAATEAADDEAAARSTRIVSLYENQGRFEVYEDAGDEYRWRLRGTNGRIVADSGEGYADRSSARDGIESVNRNAPAAEVAD